MPEENTDTGAETGAKPEADADGMTTDAGRRALAAERQKAKDLEAQVAKLKPLADAATAAEDAQKTEVQRLTDANAKLAADLGKVTGRADRLQVAIDKGLTAAQTKRLQGETVDELTADADEILAEWGAKPNTPGAPGTTPPGGKPTENLTPGGSGDGAPGAETESLDKLNALFD